MRKIVEVEYQENVNKGEEIKSYCNRCKNKLKHTVLMDIHKNDFGVFQFPDDTDAYLDNCKIDYQIIKCNECDAISFRICGWHSEREAMTDNGYYTKEYPENEELKKRIPNFKCLPKFAKELYHEAISSYNNNNLLLCAVGLRTVIEFVCKDQKTSDEQDENKDDKVKNREALYPLIDDLHRAGKISETHRSTLHELRSIGNGATHDFKSPSTEILDASFNVIDLLLRTVYELKDNDVELKSRNDKT